MARPIISGRAAPREEPGWFESLFFAGCCDARSTCGQARIDGGAQPSAMNSILDEAAPVSSRSPGGSGLRISMGGKEVRQSEDGGFEAMDPEPELGEGEGEDLAHRDIVSKAVPEYLIIKGVEGSVLKQRLNHVRTTSVEARDFIFQLAQEKDAMTIDGNISLKSLKFITCNTPHQDFYSWLVRDKMRMYQRYDTNHDSDFSSQEMLNALRDFLSAEQGLVDDDHDDVRIVQTY